MTLLAAAAAAAALTAMLFASRLPPGPELLLPRRGGYWLYRAAWGLFETGAGRAAFSAAVALLLLAAAALVAVGLRRAGRSRPRTRAARLGLALGVPAASALAAGFVWEALGLIELAWFPYGGMDAREPLAVFAILFGILGAAAAAAAAWAAGRPRGGGSWLAALTALWLAAWGAARGAGEGLPLPAAPSSGRTLYVVLTSSPLGPNRDVYLLAPDLFGDPDPTPALLGLASAARDFRAGMALRALYEEETKRWDLEGLRRALLLGAGRGDGLAYSLLLQNLSAASPSPEASAALGALADERDYRVGPLGAAAIARAYARLGDETAALSWVGKAAGPGGVPAGLLALEHGGALRPGRISGRLLAPRRARVALYLKRGPGAAYRLDASGLVAAADPDREGRFVFTGLPVGRYYLAVAASAAGERGDAVVVGHRGDLQLDARHPDLKLPPLSIRFGPR